jgi:trimethylamine--corrinoid protein Co-methyltransferase
MISPLRLNPEIMDVFFAQDANTALDIEISCSIPVLGSTAPAAFPAAFVQAAAEAIAGDFIFNTLSRREFDVLVVRLEPFDMRSGNIVFGSPEWCVFNRAACEVEAELRGRPRRYGVFRSNAKRVDAQSMSERAMSGLAQALGGVRSFGAVGQLCVDEVWSPLQAVLDRQILLYLQRVVRGFDGCWHDERDPALIIAEGLDRGSFLDAESTVAGFREIYDFTHFFTYGNLASWQAGGMRGLEDAGREEIGSILAGSRGGAQGERKEEVERIYRDASRRLLGKQP